MTDILALCSKCGQPLGRIPQYEYLPPSKLQATLADYRHQGCSHNLPLTGDAA